MRALSLVVLLTVRAAAVDIEREEYTVIGWNDACSVAVERYAYPKLGQAMQAEPVMTRVGTLSIIADKPTVTTLWAIEADGPRTWDPDAIDQARKKLRDGGYDRPGFSELLRDAEIADPVTRGVILSTANLQARPDFWPDGTWRWSGAHYNRLATCALLVFSKIGERDRFKMILSRMYNAAARLDRARAHTTNGRLLFNAGDLDAALAEVEIGARLAPELGITRYHYAAMLCLSGRIEEAMRELTAAVERDPKLAAKASVDEDFESLRPRHDFRNLIKKH
ncbi:MAG: hypothetical protein HYZ74_06315 [Elusimicrobia bacterium]|nr:hypothetical protein [Elusimicrobiota bacterium]